MNKFIMSLIGLSFCQSAFALDCFGTEPFWSAEVSTEIISLEIDRSQSAFQVTHISGARGYTEDFVKIFSNSQGPVAVIKAANCNDGMSDNEFEKEILLFTPAGTLYGCCGPAKKSSENN